MSTAGARITPLRGETDVIHYGHVDNRVGFCFFFSSGDRRGRTGHQSVHRAHRRFLFFFAGHHRARRYRVRHVLGQRDGVDDLEERGARGRRRAGAGVRHGQQRRRNTDHVRARSGQSDRGQRHSGRLVMKRVRARPSIVPGRAERGIRKIRQKKKKNKKHYKKNYKKLLHVRRETGRVGFVVPYYLFLSWTKNKKKKPPRNKHSHSDIFKSITFFFFLFFFVF